MDNAYQQKLQERAYQLCKIWHGNIVRFYDKEAKIAAMEPFLPLAALTLEWSAGDVRQALYDHGISTGGTSRTDYIRSKGFVPPKTDSNEG